MDQKQKDLIEEEDNDFFQLNQPYFYVMNSPQQLFQKLDGFVTLGDLDLEEENQLNNIQIEQPEIKDFHLNKFFSEEKREQVNLKQTQEVQHEPRLRPPRKESQQLPSFLEELEHYASNLSEKLQNFSEAHRFQDALRNIDNFTFLESNRAQPYIFNLFQSNYMRIIHKISSYKQQGRLDLIQLVKFLCSIGIEFIQELMNMIAKADNSLCFEIMKGSNQQFDVPQPIIQQQQLIQPQSNSSNEVKQRKTWTTKELNILQECINKTQNGQVSNQMIQELANSFGRSWYSVQSKVQKMRKVDNNDARSLRQDSSCIKPPPKSYKYEYTVEEMIRIALSQLGGAGTKENIMEVINKNMFNGNLTEDNPAYRSIAITLSSSKTCFLKKTKGTFGLTEQVNDRNDDDKIRSRLVQILRGLPQCRGTLKELVSKFSYGMNYDEVGLKRVQKQITQTLRSSNWFDKSFSKTIYRLE